MTTSNQSAVLIHQGSISHIYLHKKNEYHHPVVIKVLSSDHPTINQRINFYNEYEITRTLKIDGARKAIAQSRWEDKPALVMPYVPGVTLRQAFVDKKRPLADFLQAAIHITRILGELHRHPIIHRNINSQNILFDPETKEIHIIDFSLASRLDLRIRHPDNPQGLPGTLAYISPEQTGRMNRVVDHRTDLYSLGVTFYELLTGRLPFEIDDPLALVHAHLASPPEPVAEKTPDIPVIVSDIVMKLLAKNAEERYQSAFGLKADLERCLTSQTQLQGAESLAKSNFKLGRSDHIGQLHFPQKLYGRSTALTDLIDALERSTKGAQELILVSGHPGVGKSALAAQLHGPITEKRGYFIIGKFDQYRKYTPYSAIAQAFDQLADLMMIESESTLRRWRARILAAVGDNGAVLTEMIPNLEKLIGPQPGGLKLDGREGRNRLNLTFQNFVQAVSTAEHPLVIFIDDLQWADSASLELFKNLLLNEVISHFLLIGSYRHNEVNATHPLSMARDELSAKGVVIRSTHLKNLKKTDVSQLIEDSLAGSITDKQALTELVYSKTRGNAFFTRQFLRNLYEERVLRFNFDTCRWECDSNQIKTRNITDNVVELMVEKMGKLPFQTIQLLQLAACIGNQFDLQTLALVSQKSTAQALAALDEALIQGVVFPLDEYYKLPDMAGRACFVFQHDRVQQAAYSQISPSGRQKAHLTIGRLLLTNTRDEEPEQRVFDIVQHCNRAEELITAEADRFEMATLNMRAADLANKAVAFHSAKGYLETAMAFMPPDAWNRYYEQTLKLHSQLATTLALTGDVEQLERIYQITLKRACHLVDTVRVTQARIQAFISKGEFLQVLEMGVDFLDVLGFSLNHTPSPDEADQFLLETSEWLTQARIESIPHLPQAPAEEQLIMQFSQALNAPAFIARAPLYIMLNTKLVRLCIEKGLAHGALPALTNFAFLLCLILHQVPKAMDLVETIRKLAEERFPSGSLLSFVYVILGSYLCHRNRHLKHCLSILNKGVEKGLTSGNFEFAGYGVWDITWTRLFLGTPLDRMSKSCRQALGVCQKMQRSRVKEWCALPYQVTLNLKGNSEIPWVLKGDMFDEDVQQSLALESNDFLDAFFIIFVKGWLRYLFGHPREAIGCFREAEKYTLQGMGNYAETQFYLYDALANAAVCADQPTDGQLENLQRIDRSLEALEVWVRFAPMNHRHKKDLILAEKARIQGKYWEAQELYNQSIESAKANDFVSEEALANELYGQFWLDRGREEVSRVYLKKAQNLYRLWGATAKVDQLMEKFGAILAPPWNEGRTGMTESGSGIGSSAYRHSGSTDSLDIASLMKANQSLAQTVALTDLMTQMIGIVLENAGAEKAIILCPDKGDWFIEAAGKTGSQPVQTRMHTPLTETAGLPLNVLNYVIHSERTVALKNAVKDPRFGTDPYFRAEPIKSVLCMPVLYKDELTLMLYLENNLTEGAFTPNRLEWLQLLSGQMAISMENASMVDQLKTSIAERDKMQKGLEMFRFTIDQAPDAVFWIDREGRFSYVNEQACRSLGYTKTELEKLHLWDIDPEFPQAIHGEAWDIFQKGNPTETYQIESQQKCKNGSFFPVEVLARHMWFSDTELHITFVRDITERKRTEESLQINQFSFDRAAMGIYRIAEDARILEVNQRATEIIGYSREELATMTLMDIDPWVTQKSWGPIWKQLLDKSLDSFETTHIGKDGRKIPVEIHSNLLEYDGQRFSICFVQDITQRKEAEAECNQLRNYLSDIIDSMPSVLIGVDSKGRVTLWNSKAEQLTKIPPDTAIGQPIEKSYPRLSSELKRIRQAITSGKVSHATRQSRKGKDQVVYEDITIYPSNANDVEGAVIRIDDVTEKVRMEEMVVHSEKMLSVGGLAAGMAHEINNPLAGILLTCNAMQNRLGTTVDIPANHQAAEAAGTTMASIGQFMEMRKISSMIETISNSGRRVSAIVESMLSFSRKSEGTFSIHALDKIIDESLMLAATDYDLKKEYDFKNIEIEKKYAGNLPPISCERSKIQQVLLNIFGNGAQAMQMAGVDQPRLHIRTWFDKERRMACLSIEDNGPGMDEKTRKRVFEPFFTTKPVGLGTGLGLSVSYFIITENHRGEMEVESHPAEGAKFIIRLPLKENTK